VRSAVEASGLVKEYGGLRAVDGISFHIDTGECFGFLGPNGAGKTTTMRMLYGRLRRTAGRLTVLGFDPSSTARSIRERIGVVPQESNLDNELNVAENLTLHAGYFGIHGRAGRERAAELLEFVQLGGRGRNRVKELSGGMQRRLLVARALINKPDLLILDEPTTGLDPHARLVVWQRLRELRASGVTLAITSHYMEEASRLCDRLVIMDLGRIIAHGSPRELITRYAGSRVAEVSWPATVPLPAPDGDSGIRVQRSGDRLLLFAEDPAAAAHGLAGIDAEQVVIRPATLEDVFMELTGHELEEA
jgi:lipooligosaccharide transport system ATP-binding protein